MPSFRYRCFDLSSPDDHAAYEQLMQRLWVDEHGTYLISESDHWTKTGEHVVGVRYLEEDAPGPERY